MATPRKLDFPDVNDPLFDPDVPFEADNGLNYKWNGNAWEVVCGAGTETDGFLLKHGHTVDDAPDTVVYKWNQNVDVILDDNLDWTFKNEDDFLRLDGSDGDEINIYGELQDIEINASHIYMDAGYQARLTSTYLDVLLEATDGAERVNRTIDDSSIDDQIVNKRYVDEKNAFLQGEVVELEEEIEAIAISYERGEWISATDANAGNFNMRSVAAGGITQDYSDETIFTIFFSNFDAQVPSVEHGWADVEVGMILELLDKPDSDYAIFEITGKTVSASSVGFDVAYIKGVGEATLGDRTRIKIFAKPTGGNLEDYVRIDGDTMLGALKIEKPQPVNNEVSFHIKGKVKQADGSLVDGILFKDYRRANGSTSSDYVAYYGEGGGDNGIVNIGMLADYLKKVDLGVTRSGTVVTVTNTAGTNASINGATSSNAGVVTTGEQTWAGKKIFNGVINLKNKLQLNGTTTNSKFLGTDSNGNLEWKSGSSTTNYVKTNSTGFSNNMTITKSSGVYYITGG